jgi:hypothetical protein
MHYEGFPGRGICPAGGQHEQTHSFNYEIAYDIPPGHNLQGGWASCPKCQGMHYAGFPGNKGVCPAGGQHEQTHSFPYVLEYDLPGVQHTQTDWRSCSKCLTLFYGPFQGMCPVGGPHIAAGSFNYRLSYSPQPSPPPRIAQLHLNVQDRTAGLFAVTSVVWTVWRQLPGTVTALPVVSGVSAVFIPPAAGQYLIHADVSVTRAATQTSELAEFRGNVVGPGGTSALVVLWSGDMTKTFTLIAEGQGSGLYNPVVITAS